MGHGGVDVPGFISVTPSGSIDTTTVGYYYITYNASDPFENDAIPAIRVVYVGASSGAKSRRGLARAKL